MAAVSIIVPVYKSEQSLCRCIDSILMQSYSDFELILVDDGSPDTCGAICDRYADSDCRIRVIHQNNAGASSARNTGISAAKGDYIVFCDSDDMVSPDWLKHFLEYSDGNTLVVCAYCKCRAELGKEKQFALETGKRYSSQDYYEFNRAGIGGFLWNALYQRKVIIESELRLRENKASDDYNEDLIFTTTYVQLVENILYNGYSDYFYDVHEDSLSRGNKKYYFDKYAEKFRIWDAYLQNNQPAKDELRKELASNMLYHFISASREAHGIRELEHIICSTEMQHCLSWADTSGENHFEIVLLQHKRILLLYCFYLLLRIKEKILS